MTDSPHIATPGKKLKLASLETKFTGRFSGKDDAAQSTAALLAELSDLQERLYAEAARALLVIFQAPDAGGKDGAVDTVFSGVNPQGCSVTSFKVPSSLEKSHDFLWRHHLACPSRGMIGIHNRSHYEAVLVERVHELVPKKIWSARYDQINAFEKTLVAEGTTVLKFFLHISKQEQKERLQKRLDERDKHWKFNIGDLGERARWDDYQAAYEDAIENCSTTSAPWYVIPADNKWYRNYAIAKVIVDTLKEMNPKFPKPSVDLSNVKVM
jgi:PPK2 family polyphosphate:nucleotide phosphotransferase